MRGLGVGQEGCCHVLELSPPHHHFADHLHHPSPPALHLIGSHRCFEPTEWFYDGNSFQVERGIKIVLMAF